MYEVMQDFEHQHFFRPSFALESPDPLSGCSCKALLSIPLPEGPSSQYLRPLVPKTIQGVFFGSRILKYWVLGPSGSAGSAVDAPKVVDPLRGPQWVHVAIWYIPGPKVVPMSLRFGPCMSYIGTWAHWVVTSRDERNLNRVTTPKKWVRVQSPTRCALTLWLKTAPKTLRNMVFGPQSSKVSVFRALGYWYRAHQGTWFC